MLSMAESMKELESKVRSNKIFFKTLLKRVNILSNICTFLVFVVLSPSSYSGKREGREVESPESLD